MYQKKQKDKHIKLFQQFLNIKDFKWLETEEEINKLIVECKSCFEILIPSLKLSKVEEINEFGEEEFVESDDDDFDNFNDNDLFYSTAAVYADTALSLSDNDDEVEEEEEEVAAGQEKAAGQEEAVGQEDEAKEKEEEAKKKKKKQIK